MLSPCCLVLVELRDVARGRAWNSPTPAPLWQTPWRNRQPEYQTQPAFYARLKLSSRPARGAVARPQGREKAGNPGARCCSSHCTAPPHCVPWPQELVRRGSCQILGGTGRVSTGMAQQKDDTLLEAQ